MVMMSVSSILGSLAACQTGSSSIQSTALADISSVLQDPSPQISKLASYMQQLKDLQKSDPEKFKAVTSEIADKLNDEAKKAGDSGDTQQASRLTELADKFEKASQDGSMPDLRPSGGSGSHRAHHHHGAPPPPPPDDDDNTTSGDSSSNAPSSSTAIDLTSLFQQNLGSDPMATLTSVLDSVLSSQQS